MPVIDHYWQTETGWPILDAVPGVEKTPTKFGSPAFPAYGYDVQLLHEGTGEEVRRQREGRRGVVPPLPPGCLSTVWGQDERFVKTYFTSFRAAMVYTTFDWGIRDSDGYYFILGRTDDVINVAGHRLGTREIEEAVSGHANIAEVAVVGVADQLKGQVPVAFAVVKDPRGLPTPRPRTRWKKRCSTSSTRRSVRSADRRGFTSSRYCRRRARARCYGAYPGHSRRAGSG